MKNLRLLLTALLAVSGGALSGGALALDLKAPPFQMVQPGDLVVLAIPVTGGTASACQKALLSYKLPQGWTAVSPTRELCLGGPEVALVALQVPRNALAGDYALPLLLESGMERRSSSGMVRVDAVADFLLLPPQGELPFTGRPEVYQIQLTNLGNANDTYKIKVQGATLLGPDLLILKAGEQKLVEVRFVPPRQGNAGTISLEVQSSRQPGLRDRKTIVLGSRRQVLDALEFQRNRLNWSLDANGSLGYALPAETLSLGGGVGASLSGQLSNTANLSSSYRIQGQEGQPLSDSLAIAVTAPNQESSLNASLLGGSVNVSHAFRANGLSYFLGTGYQKSGQIYAQAAVQASRFGASLFHSFPLGTRSFEDTLALNYSDQFGGVRLSTGLSVVYRDATATPLSFEVSQGADFGTQDFRVAQSYRYSSLTDAHRFSLDASTRPLQSVILAGGTTLAFERNALFYSLNGLLGYQPNTEWSTEIGGGLTNLSSNAFWNLSYSPQLSWGRLAFSNRLSLQNGFLDDRYRAGIQWKEANLSASAFAQGGLQGINGAGLSTLFSPLEGYVAGASLEANFGRDWLYSFKANAGYQELDWQLEGRYQLDWNDEVATRSLLGLSAAARLAPELSLRAGYSLDNLGNSSVSLSADSKVSSSFTTPTAIEELFGGTDIGRIEVVPYVDRNLNNLRDLQEPALSIRLAINGVDRRTSTGVLSLDLREGDYTVNLSDDVAASYALGLERPPTARVKRGQTTRVFLAVREVVGIQGRAFVDSDKSGKQSETEAALPQVAVVVRAEGFERRVLTDSSGFYTLNGLKPGRYSVQLESSSSVQLPGPVEVTLVAGQPPTMVNFATAPMPEQKQQSFNVNDLTLELQLPSGAVPPEATLTLEARTGAPADTVILEVGGQTLELTPDVSRTRWQGRLRLSPISTEVLFVQGKARVGDEVAEAQNFLRLDAQMPLIRVELAPVQALAGQVMQINVTSYKDIREASLRLEDGSLTPLNSISPYLYAAEFRAAKTPGEYRVTLVLDGQDYAEYVYNVLDITAQTQASAPK